MDTATPPTPPTPSSPPSYAPPPSVGHPNTVRYPQPPAFRQRRSSTIVNFVEQPAETSSRSATRLSTATAPHLAKPSPGSPVRPSSSGSSLAIGSGSHSAQDDEQISALPLHMRQNMLSRTPSNSSTASDRLAEEGEATPLLANQEEGSTRKWWKGPIALAGLKFALLFLVFTAVVVGTFYFCLPKMDPEDKGLLKLPRSFADLQALNSLFQKYKARYPLRILACGVVTYLFVQTFTLPGSMYISILFGAAYGIIVGLLLSCLCDAFGSLLCYTLSSLLAPPLLALPFYRARVETWRIKIMGDPNKNKEVTWDSIFAFLLVLRIAPFPPHWIANFVAPHLGINPFLFWSSCFIGIGPISVIHVTIGSSLDGMTSAADFHLLSLRNILGLCAVVVAVLIPVGLKRVFKKDLGDLGEAEEVLENASSRDRDIDVPPIGEGMGRRYHAIDSGVVLSAPSRGDGMGSKLVKGKGRALEIIPDLDEDDGEMAGISFSSELEGMEADIEAGIAEATRDNISDHEEVWEYEVFDPEGRVQRVHVNRTRPSSRSSRRQEPRYPTGPRGYGAIEPSGPETPLAEPSAPPSTSRWWPFGSD
ncbi:hypothetical protein IAU60_004713 [Kwoniella sp. DSM 27419]